MSRGCRIAWAVLLSAMAGCTLGPWGPSDFRGREAAGGRPPFTASTGLRADPALRRLAASVATHPSLDDLRLHTQARMRWVRGDLAGAITAVETLVAEHPDSAWVPAGRVLLGKVRRRTGDLVAARDAFASAREGSPPGSATWTHASLQLAEVQAGLGDLEAARALANALRDGKLQGLVLRRARRLADRLTTHPDPTPATLDEQITEAERRLRERDPNGALAALDAAASSAGLWQDRLVIARARALRDLGHGQAAEHALLEFAAAPSATLAPKAIATVARWRWNANDDARALELYQTIARRFPGTAEAGDAWYAIGRIHQEAGRLDEATAAYTNVVEGFSTASFAPEARWRTGWCAYLAGDYVEAARRFAAMTASGPLSIGESAAYWEARSLERLGHPDAALRYQALIERDPDGYYGGLALAQLGLATEAVEIDIAPDTAVFPDAIPSEHAERARTLLDLGYPHLARRELDALEPWISDDARMRAYEAAGAPGPALKAAARLGDPRDAEVRRRLYPLGYWGTVQPAAAAVAVDPLLVAALIRQESLFFPEAVSAADAHGLMQLLPRTAREVALQSGLPVPARARLTDVASNVSLGTRHLRTLLDRYAGSRVKALAAYNAGVDAVALWERRYGERPDDEFVESISFRETRDYVKAVLHHYAAYRALYAASPSATSFGNPPNAPFDMIAMTSPAHADATR